MELLTTILWIVHEVWNHVCMLLLILMPTWWVILILIMLDLYNYHHGWHACIVMWHKQAMCWMSMLLMQYNARLWWNSMMWWSYDDLGMITLYWYSLVQSCVNDSCLDDNDVGYMNDCHASMSVTRCVLICRMLLGLPNELSRDVGKASTYSSRSWCCTLTYASSLMWHIYDCLYRDRWASHRFGIPELSVHKCECSYNLRCSAAADRKLRGLSANSLCPIVSPCRVGLFAQQV